MDKVKDFTEDQSAIPTIDLDLDVSGFASGSGGDCNPDDIDVSEVASRSGEDCNADDIDASAVASGSGGDCKPDDIDVSGVVSGRGGNCNPDHSSELQKQLTHLAVECPIGKCTEHINMTSLLAHCLGNHIENSDMPCQEIFADEPINIVFVATALKFRVNVCLGLLFYGGINDESTHLPAQRGMCSYNIFLPKANENLTAHMPVMIMACRTSWSAILRDKSLEAKFINPHDMTQHILVIWLVSVMTTKPLRCSITVYDNQREKSRNCVAKLRCLYDTQNPSEFLPKDTNYLFLTNDHLESFAPGSEKNVHLEIIIHEYENFM